MRKTTVSDDQLQKIIKLRQSGHKWIDVQEQVGPERRACKRAYDNWAKSRSIEQLQVVRQRVAEDMLRQHLDLVVEYAGALAQHLPEPSSDDMRPSTKVVEDTLNNLAIDGVVDTQRNHILHDSLRQHAADQAWPLLEQWCDCWDGVLEIFHQLRASCDDHYRRFLKPQPDLLPKAAKYSGEDDVNAVMLPMIYESAWGTVHHDQGDSSNNYVFRSAQISTNQIVVTFPAFRDIPLLFKKHASAQQVCDLLAETADNTRRYVCETAAAANMRDALNRLAEITDALKDSLHPLCLEPVLIKTRCKLCPI